MARRYYQRKKSFRYKPSAPEFILLMMYSLLKTKPPKFGNNFKLDRKFWEGPLTIFAYIFLGFWITGKFLSWLGSLLGY
jgi:hypothetical protein